MCAVIDKFGARSATVTARRNVGVSNNALQRFRTVISRRSCGPREIENRQHSFTRRDNLVGQGQSTFNATGHRGIHGHVFDLCNLGVRGLGRRYFIFDASERHQRTLQSSVQLERCGKPRQIIRQHKKVGP